MTESVWRNRDFRLVWAGGLVNDMGDWLLMVALPLYVFTETQSGIATALLFIVEMAPAVLLGTIAGGFVDRWDLRRTLIATNVLQALALLPLLAVTPDRIWPAFVVAAVQSSLARFNNPAKAALLPRLVGAENLVAANSAGAISENVSRLVGSPLGGLLVSVGGLESVIIADGVSFLIVAVAMVVVRWRPAAKAAVATRPDRRGGDVRDGLDIIRRTRPLPSIMVSLLLSQFAQGLFLVLFIAFVVRRLGGSGTDVGVIRGLQAVGGIPGAFIIGRYAKGVHPGRLAGWGFVGMGLFGFVSWNAPVSITATAFYAGMFVASGTPAVAIGSVC